MAIVIALETDMMTEEVGVIDTMIGVLMDVIGTMIVTEDMIVIDVTTMVVLVVVVDMIVTALLPETPAGIRDLALLAPMTVVGLHLLVVAPGMFAASAFIVLGVMIALMHIYTCFSSPRSV